MDHGTLNTGQCSVFGDGRAAVIDAVGCLGPSIVSSRANDIEFVPAPWAMFVGPDNARGGVLGGSLYISVAIRINLGVESLFIYEGLSLGILPLGQIRIMDPA